MRSFTWLNASVGLALLVIGCGDSPEDCPLYDVCDEEGASCTYDSGPCTVTLECGPAEGSPVWYGTDATCDVPPVECDLANPSQEYSTNGAQWSHLVRPIADGDRCAFVGIHCRYTEQGCKTVRTCQDDNTWSAATTVECS